MLGLISSVTIQLMHGYDWGCYTVVGDTDTAS